MCADTELRAEKAGGVDVKSVRFVTTCGCAVVSKERCSNRHISEGGGRGGGGLSGNREGVLASRPFHHYAMMGLSRRHRQSDSSFSSTNNETKKQNVGCPAPARVMYLALAAKMSVLAHTTACPRLSCQNGQTWVLFSPPTRSPRRTHGLGQRPSVSNQPSVGFSNEQ